MLSVRPSSSEPNLAASSPPVQVSSEPLLAELPLWDGQISGPNPADLSIERINSSPSLSGSRPQSLRFSPDGKSLTFLRPKEGAQQKLDLWIQDIESGDERILLDSGLFEEGELSSEEKARRERQRFFARGITSYTLAEDGKSLVLPQGGSIYHCSIADSTPLIRCVVEDAGATDVKLSPNGRYISYISQDHLWVYDLACSEATQVSRGDALRHGVAEFVAQEEMGRYTGYWWSPDSSHIAYLSVDENPVAETERYEINADGIEVVKQRYPYTGTDNVDVALHIARLDNEGIEPQWRTVDLGDDSDIYIPRVQWGPEGKALYFQRQSRDQKTLELFRQRLDRESAELVHRKTSESYVNLDDDLRILKSGEILWTSEESGYKHIHLLSEGSTRVLTAGEWPVDRIVAVDEDWERVYWEGFATDPLERHLYVSDLRGQTQEFEQLTEGNGTHRTTLAPDLRSFIDVFSAPMIPPQTRLHSIDGEQQRFIDENALDESHPYHPYLSHHVEPEFGTLTASDGQTLHYRLIKPFNFDETKRYPVVVGVYGGPCARRVKKQWDPGEAWAQHMAQQGFVHFTLDNRGSSERGKVFEEPIHGLLGEIEIADQKRGVRWLQSQDFVDPERVGIFGWSYGGYMAIMALAKASDVFKAAVSVAPVTDWHLYDTHYTERYLGHPVDNPEGYARSAVFPYLDDLKGDLLVVHGMADDNVLFEHTTKLYAALQKRKIAFETMAYPGSKHSIAEAHNRVHLFQMITRFFQRTLGKPMSTSSDI